MPNINLLPWRESLREARKTQFLISLGLSLGGVVCVMIVVHMIFATRIRNQHALNTTLKQEISQLDQAIISIRQLRQQRDQLITRMTIIQKLQASRPATVRLFDELVRILPDGIYFSDIKRQGSSFFITGQAQSNASISALMRKIEQSNWFDAPRLTEIKKNGPNGVHENHFEMQLQHNQTLKRA